MKTLIGAVEPPEPPKLSQTYWIPVYPTTTTVATTPSSGVLTITTAGIAPSLFVHWPR